MIKANFVRYVMADGVSAKGGCSITPKFGSALVSDVIDVVEYLPVAANTTQPVWLSTNIPENIPAGFYKGKLRLRHKTRESLEH